MVEKRNRKEEKYARPIDLRVLRTYPGRARSICLSSAKHRSGVSPCPCVLDHKFANLLDEPVSLCQFRAKVLLIVNTALPGSDAGTPGSAPHNPDPHNLKNFSETVVAGERRPFNSFQPFKTLNALKPSNALMD